MGNEPGRVLDRRRHRVRGRAPPGGAGGAGRARGCAAWRAGPRLCATAWRPRRRWCRGTASIARPSSPRCEGVETAFYLVHSMGLGDDFAAQDRRAAQNFAAGRGARAACGRIVYLGGLGNVADRLSAHLRSRQETGALLAAHRRAGGGVPRVRDRRFRLAVVRDGAVAGRAPARHALPALGAGAHPADRDRGRVAYLRRRPRRCRKGGEACSRSAGPTSCRTATSCASWRGSAASAGF